MRKKGYYKKPKKKNDIITGTQVEVFNNNIELAIKKFKRKIKDSGLMVELRDRQYYEKPSNQRRRKKGLAKLRNKYRTEKTNQWYLYMNYSVTMTG